MVHIPSFFVGGLFSGASFLLVHQQLSHRNKLSKKWVVQGTSNNRESVHTVLSMNTLLFALPTVPTYLIIFLKLVLTEMAEQKWQEVRSKAKDTTNDASTRMVRFLLFIICVASKIGLVFHLVLMILY